ncbi:MAG: IS110 family transposase [Fulvivirga sp.]
MSKVIGIDISKATFDVCFSESDGWVHKVLSNDSKGFRAFYKLLTPADHCVMEASGPYYLQLALFLSQKGVGVSVVNPVVIRRFAQMKLIRAKTDKKDARLIAEYGIQESPKLWKAEDESIMHMKQMFTALQGISRQLHISCRQLNAFMSSGVICPQVKRTLNSLIKTLRLKKEQLEKQLFQLAKQHYKESFERLQSIPGIGPKTATLLTVITHDFTKFENSRQLIAYIGLSPRVYQSGISVKGKGHICKMGNSLIRKQLYLCSWTAKFCNRSCREMYKRLKSKGKPERVIKIAIANKLLKQAFSIAKSGIHFNENHIPKPCF